MPLPIIRLSRTSDNNATLTSDPLEATATLYTFLRSVPSEAEVRLSMGHFRAALQRRYAEDMEAVRGLSGVDSGDSGSVDRLSAAAALTRQVPLPAAEEALRVRVEAALFNGVLRQPPRVSPEWCRQQGQWREIFRPRVKEGREETSEARASDALSAPPRAMKNDADFSEDGAREQLRVQTEALRQFMTPYELYEQQRQREEQQPSASLLAREQHTMLGRDEDPGEEEEDGLPADAALQRSGSTQPPVSDGGESSTRVRGEREQTRGQPSSVGHSSVESWGNNDSVEGRGGRDQMENENSMASSARSSSPAVDRAESISPVASAFASSTMEDTASARQQTPHIESAREPLALPTLCATASAEGAVYHPLLTLLARQVRQPLNDDKVSGHSDDDDNAKGFSRRTETAVIEAKSAAVQRTLAEADSEVHTMLAAMEEAGEAWQPSFTHARSATNFIAELRARAQAAASLQRVEAYETHTIEAAHIALMMEVMSMRLLLRDVHRAVDDAAAQYLERHHRGELVDDPATVADADLMAELIHVLAALIDGEEE